MSRQNPRQLPIAEVNFEDCYDNLFLGDFNAEYASMKNFCSAYSLTNMINKPTCYKNPKNPSCMDLILTNCPHSFQISCVIETGLSDFHKIVITWKLKLKVIKYRGYKYFCNGTVRESLQDIFSHNLKNSCNDYYSNFPISCKNVLDKIPTWKKKLWGEIIRHLWIKLCQNQLW